MRKTQTLWLWLEQWKQMNSKWLRVINSPCSVSLVLCAGGQCFGQESHTEQHWFESMKSKRSLPFTNEHPKRECCSLVESFGPIPMTDTRIYPHAQSLSVCCSVLYCIWISRHNNFKFILRTPRMKQCAKWVREIEWERERMRDSSFVRLVHWSLFQRRKTSSNVSYKVFRIMGYKHTTIKFSLLNETELRFNLWVEILLKVVKMIELKRSTTTR